MLRSLLAAVITMAGLFSAGQIAQAQDASAVTIVVYAEVAPAKAAEAKKLILGYAAEARKAKGALDITALQRISDPGHFALIERWQSQADKQAFAADADSRSPSIAPRSILWRSAACDERIHADQAVGASKPTNGEFWLWR